MVFDWNPDRVSTLHYNAVMNDINPSQLGNMLEYHEEREEFQDEELDEPKIKLITSNYKLYPKVVNFKKN